MPRRLFAFRPTPIGRNDLLTPSKISIFNSLLSTNTHILLSGSASCISLGCPEYTVMGASCILLGNSLLVTHILLLGGGPANTLGHFFTGSTYTMVGATFIIGRDFYVFI